MDGAARRRAAAAHLLIPGEHLATDVRIELDEQSAHHLGRVLRLRPGSEVTVTDGEGGWRPAVIVGPGELEPVGPVEHEPRCEPPLTIATAIPKGDRVDLLVQKVTEIGADRVVLLHAERSVVRWDEARAARNVARLQRIADEACRQSRRVHRLVVEGPRAALEVLPRALMCEPGGRGLRAGDDLLAVGPEGGWSDREMASAVESVELGPTILRTETAAIVAATRADALRRRSLDRD